jgi:hypothetical protein
MARVSATWNQGRAFHRDFAPSKPLGQGVIFDRRKNLIVLNGLANLLRDQYRSFLDFVPSATVNPPTSRKDVLFDPPPGP